MNKAHQFDQKLREIASFAKAVSHPARLEILQFLAKSDQCITGDISEHIPLSRSTVSQHLKALKQTGIIQGNIDGLKINYCINNRIVENYFSMMHEFFIPVMQSKNLCK